MHYKQRILLLILISSLVRMLIAGILEFGNDEVYYWTYAQHLQWNYFDHPPMVAWLIRFSTLNLLLQQAFFVRLGAIICSAANTWILFQIGKKISNERAGWFAALFYTSSLYFSVIAGTFILPDAPQVFWWMVTVYLLVSLADETLPSRKTNMFLLASGLCIGLCTMSKVSGIFLWLALGLYILFYRRQLLRSPALYLSALLTALIVSPILLWNIQNHFVTYNFHNKRVGIASRHLDFDSFIQQLFGSIAYQNPINFVMYVIAITGILKNKSVLDRRYTRILLLSSLPLILLLFFVALFNETLPHWSGPAYTGIVILSGIWFAQRIPITASMPRGLKWSLGVIIFVIAVGIPGIKLLPFNIGSKEKAKLGAGDVTLDLNGWKYFGRKFDSLRESDIASNRMSANTKLMADYWFPAAHLQYYVARPLSMEVFAVGGLSAIHHYAWLNKKVRPMQNGADAYFIYPSNYYGPPKPVIRNCFQQVDSIAIPQIRGDKIVRYFVIYRLHHYTGGLPTNGVITEEN